MALSREEVIAEVKKLAEAPSVYAGLKEKAEHFLRAAGTAEEHASFHKLVEELKGDVLTIDQLIGFTDSPDGVKVFGEKKAQELTIAAKKAKEQGEDTCICPACQARRFSPIRRSLANQTNGRKGAAARMCSCDGFFFAEKGKT